MKTASSLQTSVSGSSNGIYDRKQRVICLIFVDPIDSNVSTLFDQNSYAYYSSVGNDVMAT